MKPRRWRIHVGSYPEDKTHIVGPGCHRSPGPWETLTVWADEYVMDLEKRATPPEVGRCVAEQDPEGVGCCLHPAPPPPPSKPIRLCMFPYPALGRRCGISEEAHVGVLSHAFDSGTRTTRGDS